MNPTPSRRRARASRWPPRGLVRVLLMTDQPLVAQLIRLTLGHGLYDTRTATTRADALAAVAAWQPHLILVDMDLDDGETLKATNAAPVTATRRPTIALTRRGNLKTKLAAFQLGADDILTVAFAPEELLARVVALVRRSYGDAMTFTPIVKVGGIDIDILNRTVRNGVTQLRLSPLEQSLLYLLAANVGRVVTRDEILDMLWGTDYVAESNIVDRQIRNLRTRLRDDWRAPRFIATVPGRGYQFVARAV